MTETNLKRLQCFLAALLCLLSSRAPTKGEDGLGLSAAFLYAVCALAAERPMTVRLLGCLQRGHQPSSSGSFAGSSPRAAADFGGYGRRFARVGRSGGRLESSGDGRESGLRASQPGGW